MSNKTRLQTNNTNLQALIDKANALPEAGSGGGSVETCTVTVTFTGGNPDNIWISGVQFADDNIQPFTFIHYVNDDEEFVSPFSIFNIVKDSPLVIIGNGFYAISTGGFTLEGCELLYAVPTQLALAIKITETNAFVGIRNDY